jgi:hypothetical protein
MARSTPYSQVKFSEIVLAWAPRPSQQISIPEENLVRKDSRFCPGGALRKVIMKTLFISLLPVVLFYGMLSRDAAAESSAAVQSSTGFIGWDTNQAKSRDVSVTSIIQQVIPNHSSSIPAGLHVILLTPQGVLDVSVGPYLTQDIQQTLIPGAQVQAFGQLKTIHDQTYLLARQLVLNGRLITIRNDHGSLVHTRTQTHTRSQSSLNDQVGGAQ